MGSAEELMDSSSRNVKLKTECAATMGQSVSEPLQQKLTTLSEHALEKNQSR